MACGPCMARERSGMYPNRFSGRPKPVILGTMSRGGNNVAGLRPVGAGLLVLMMLAGCGTGNAVGPAVVLERGHFGRWPWQLVAWEQGGQLGLAIDGATQTTQYSGGVGFSADPSGGYWVAGLGPGNSGFDYGPAPSSATFAVLTAPGHPAIVVPTRPIPHGAGLPSGRFFVVTPRPAAVPWWNVTLRDAAGHTVAFADF